MGFMDKLRSVAAHHTGVVDSAPSRGEREGMEENLAEVQAVRDRIAAVVKARESHALVAEQMDISVRELNELDRKTHV